MAENIISDESGLSIQEEQYLTFNLDGQNYGLPILMVQEIKGWTSVTELPNSPNYIRGVLNLRGAIVPVTDLRLRFDLPEKEYDELTVIILVKIGNRLSGIVVDSVSDVISVKSEDIKENPEYEGNINRAFISGLAHVRDQLFIILDVAKTIDNEVSETSAE